MSDSLAPGAGSSGASGETAAQQVHAAGRAGHGPAGAGERAPVSYAVRAPAGAGGRADILALGFGTTVLMWAVGFVGRLPGAALPNYVLFLLMLACLLAGGVATGWLTTRGARGGGWVGLVAGVLNLLILGSLLSAETVGQTLARAAVFVPGSLLISVALAAGGAVLGRGLRGDAPPHVNWPATFAGVAGVATLLLLAVGGTVTGTDSGLAVVDWPNTEGHNMFLYPLARMTGGIYYEHAHRLIGSLVGLTTLVLTLYIQLSRYPRRLKVFAWVIFAMVVVQGVLGGLRVTGRFTLSTAEADTAPNIVLAIVHGVFGQVFFACLVGLALLLTQVWQARRHLLPAPSASTDHFFGVVLLVILLVQLVLGALVRHFTWALHVFDGRYGLAAPPEALADRGTWALHLHITVAVVAVLVAIGAGVRLWGLYGQSPVLRRLGTALLVLILVQVALGVAALLVVGNDSPENLPGPLDVLLTTLHQTVGALLLGLALLIVLAGRRFLMEEEAPRPAAALQ